MGLKERIDVIKAAVNIGSAAFSNRPTTLMQQKFSQIFSPIWSLPPRRNVGQWIDMYMKSPRMNPVHKISNDVALANYRLYTGNKKDKETWKEIIDHPLLNLLENPIPNKEFTGRDLLYLTQVYLLLPSGEAFWLIERNALGVPTELWILPPHWVLQTPTLNTPYFRILPQGNTTYKQIYVDPDDMIWIKEPDPYNPYWRGRGRTEAIGDEIETDEYAAKYQKKFFFNDAIPPAVGTAPGADEPTIKRMDEQWKEKYGGAGNAHKVAWLPWDAKIQILKESNKEMDFVESRKYLRDTANQFWGIPPELFGILENSNRSTIDAAYYIYTKNVLSSRLNALDEAINRQLVPLFDKKLFLRHDNVVPEDEEFNLKRDTEGLKYGAIMVDEWRTGQGRKPLKNKKGEILYTPLNMMPTDINSQSIIDAHVQETQTEDGKIMKSFSDKKKEVIWKGFDRSALKYEKSFERAAKKYFQGQQDRVTKSLSKKSYLDTHEHEIRLRFDDPTTWKTITDDPDELVNWDEEDKKLKEAMETYWIESLTEGFEFANSTYAFELGFDVFNPKFKKWVEKNGLDRAKMINDTTKEKLRKTLSEGIEAGESIPKLRDRVSTVYDDAKKSRATLIARTETITTVNFGAMETYIEAGVKKHSWLATRDGRTRESHSSIDGETVDIGKKFSNGCEYPGDPSGGAQEICNCRCTIIPVIEDDND